MWNSFGVLSKWCNWNTVLNMQFLIFVLTCLSKKMKQMLIWHCKVHFLIEIISNGNKLAVPFNCNSIHDFGEGNDNPLQYSCLEGPMDRGAWWATVHGVTKSWTRLSDFTFTFHFHALEKEMATHSSVLAWRILGTGEPGGLPSKGSHRVGHVTEAT